MRVNCWWESTASAPCAKDSLILSCFNSLREMCSDTVTLLNDLEPAIVAQETDWPGGRRLVWRLRQDMEGVRAFRPALNAEARMGVTLGLMDAKLRLTRQTEQGILVADGHPCLDSAIFFIPGDSLCKYSPSCTLCAGGR